MRNTEDSNHSNLTWKYVTVFYLGKGKYPLYRRPKVLTSYVHFD